MCSCKCEVNCPLLSVAAAVIIGVVTAFLRITAVITVTPAFLWVALGIAVVYLAVILVSTSLIKCSETRAPCICPLLTILLTGILGTILLSVILLAIEFVATSIIGAIITGALLGFLSLLLTSTACLVKCISRCDS